MVHNRPETSQNIPCYPPKLLVMLRQGRITSTHMVVLSYNPTLLNRSTPPNYSDHHLLDWLLLGLNAPTSFFFSSKRLQVFPDFILSQHTGPYQAMASFKVPNPFSLVLSNLGIEARSSSKLVQFLNLMIPATSRSYVSFPKFTFYIFSSGK